MGVRNSWATSVVMRRLRSSWLSSSAAMWLTAEVSVFISVEPVCAGMRVS